MTDPYRKWIGTSRRAWGVALASVAVIVPAIDPLVGVDLPAMIGATDKVVQSVLALGVALLNARSLIKPDAAGTEIKVSRKG